MIRNSDFSIMELVEGRSNLITAYYADTPPFTPFLSGFRNVIGAPNAVHLMCGIIGVEILLNTDSRSC